LYRCFHVPIPSLRCTLARRERSCTGCDSPYPDITVTCSTKNLATASMEGAIPTFSSQAVVVVAAAVVVILEVIHGAVRFLSITI
jgi:hypothetical protein